jgi:hypothetical protein
LFNLPHGFVRKSFFLVGILATSARIAPAQALVTAQRGAEIAPFAQTVLLSPDWGQTNNIGYTVGIDYTRFIRSIVQPSLELRMTSASGTTVNEQSYLGGLKLQPPAIHRVHPYVAILGGRGFIDFNHATNGYTGDNSFVFSIAGGARFPITSQLDLTVDYSWQQWNLDPQTLNPTTLGVGVAYRIPFHSGRVQ